MAKTLKNIVENSSPLLHLKYWFLYWIHYLDYLRRSDPREIQMARSKRVFFDCPDWQRISKVSDAGKIRGGYLVMHNGIRVLPTAYLGYANYRIMAEALGVHEPQEERLFRDVLPHLKPGSVMVELGAFWAFYSIWFSKTVPNARAICVEPELSHLNYGRHHAAVNSVDATFYQAFSGRTSSVRDGIETISLDDLLDKMSVDRLGVLHADIQGFELEMLQGGKRVFDRGGVDYAFISTHSEELHEQCRHFLHTNGMRILADVPLEFSWNPDGVLLAQSLALPEFKLERPSLRHLR
jgi:hypothetical protein